MAAVAAETCRVHGTYYRAEAGGELLEPRSRALIRFRPSQLDETGHMIHSSKDVVVTTDEAGRFEVRLAPGAWVANLPDGEQVPFVGVAGGDYDLHDLRGYVAPPGVPVQVIEVPADLAGDVQQALGAADRAEDAEAGAQAAQIGAETAQSAAMSAAGAAQAAQAGAEGHRDAAADHAAHAEAHSDTAQGAAQLASAQAAEAGDARDAAQAAAEAAGSAASGAQISAGGAAESAQMALTAGDNARTARDQAETARDEAVQARDDTNSLNLTADATTLAPGSAATGSVSGSLPDLHLDIGVPQGAKGDTPVAQWDGTALGFDGGPKVDLRGAKGDPGDPLGPHAASHATGGADPLTPATIGAMPAATGTPDGTKFLRDDGSWQVVGGGGIDGGYRLVHTYTHTSNRVVDVVGFDEVTGEFLAPGHGLEPLGRIAWLADDPTDLDSVLNRLPTGAVSTQNQASRVATVTADTFTVEQGPITSHDGMDFTSIHAEFYGQNSISLQLSNLGVFRDVVVEVAGRMNLRYVNAQVVGGTGGHIWVGPSIYGDAAFYGVRFLRGVVQHSVREGWPRTLSAKARQLVVSGTTLNSTDFYYAYPGGGDAITGVTLYNGWIGNGSVFRIWGRE